MSKIKVELTELEIVNVINHLTIRYQETEKRCLEIQKDIIQEHDPKWKETMSDLLNDYHSEIIEISELIKKFRKAEF